MNGYLRIPKSFLNLMTDAWGKLKKASTIYVTASGLESRVFVYYHIYAGSSCAPDVVLFFWLVDFTWK